MALRLFAFTVLGCTLTALLLLITPLALKGYLIIMDRLTEALDVYFRYAMAVGSPQSYPEHARRQVAQASFIVFVLVLIMVWSEVYRWYKKCAGPVDPKGLAEPLLAVHEKA